MGDVANANIMACESNFNGIVNIAGGSQISVNKLYEIVKKTLNTNILPKYLPERLSDIRYSQADTGNMKHINLKIDNEEFEII